MIVEDKKVVSLTYQVRTESVNGPVADEADTNNTLDFVYGLGNMIPLFEEGIKGLSVNQEFKFDIKSEDAYGPYSEEQVVELPIDIFKEKGKINKKLLVVGNVVPLRDENNNHFNGTILNFNESIVNIDFNHPLAGKHLFFSGKIIDIREATSDEIAHGHIHDENCSGCGNH